MSQLAALSTDSPLLHFRDNDFCVSLAPHLRSLGKNVWKIVWDCNGESHHVICPVGALHAYLATAPRPQDRIWKWLGLNCPCPSQLAVVICKVVYEAVPEASPRAPHARGITSTPAYLRSFESSRDRNNGCLPAHSWTPPSAASSYSSIHHCTKTSRVEGVR